MVKLARSVIKLIVGSDDSGQVMIHRDRPFGAVAFADHIGRVAAAVRKWRNNTTVVITVVAVTGYC